MCKSPFRLSQSIKEGLERLERQAIQVGGSSLYAPLIQCCGNARAIEDGRSIHRHLLRHGYGGNTFLGNLIIQMYRQCGSMEEARWTFDSMARKDIVSWNAMISGYAEGGQGREALDLYQRMDSEGVEPNRATLLGVLGACGDFHFLGEGRSIHSRIRLCKRDCDTALESALIAMYARCGSIQEAKEVFDGVSRKNVVCWTAMITAYSQTGHFDKAVGIYQAMTNKGVEPNSITFIAVLTAIASLGDLKFGEEVHARISFLKFRPDGPLGNALISMYSKCRRIERARKVFDAIKRRNVVTWTSMITAYTLNGMAREALELYRNMDVEPNFVTYTSVLNSCSVLGDLDQGKEVHARVTSSNQPLDIVLETALISMYGNCGSLRDARMIFDNMKHRNILSWNTILGAYAHFGGSDQAGNTLCLFREMELEGVRANSVSFVSAISSCGTIGDLKQGQALHLRVTDMDFLPHRNLETAFITMYAKCHRLEEARRVFDKMEHKDRDVVTWTSLIAAYSQEGRHREAMRLYKRMRREGEIEPNSVTLSTVLCSCLDIEDGRKLHEEAVSGGMIDSEIVLNSILNMYVKCGSMEDAIKVFEAMDESSRTVVSWNTLLTAYTQAGNPRQAIDLYMRMIATGKADPDQTTIAVVLAACSSLGDFHLAQELHLLSLENLQSNSIVVQNAILNLHAKCGFLDEGRRIFEAMDRRRNLVSWTAMIVGYAKHGDADQAMELYRRMHQDGAQPDAVTFISFLVACSHSGLVSSGHQCFLSMAGDCDIAPELDHYVCVVDLLGRAGFLEEAQELVGCMPFEAPAVAWMTLLGACSIHRDWERARIVEKRVFELNPEECGLHVLLANIYAT